MYHDLSKLNRTLRNLFEYNQWRRFLNLYLKYQNAGNTKALNHNKTTQIKI